MKLDFARKATTVVLAAACLMVVPGLASAAFDRSVSATQAVSTASLATPTALTGTYQCWIGLFRKGATVKVTKLDSPSQPAGATYEYRLSRTRGGASGWAPFATNVEFTEDQAWDLRNHTWYLEVRARVRDWTGTPVTSQFECRAGDSDSGGLRVS